MAAAHRVAALCSELRKCIANLQYAFTYFYDESFVLPYFAAINSFIDEVDMETGSSISALNFMIDKFLNNEKSLLLRSLADGYPFHTWRPLGGYTRFEGEIMPLVRTVHNKTTEKKVKAFSAQITGLEARLKAIRTATSVPPASKKAPKKAPKRPPTPSPLKSSPLKKVKPEPPPRSQADRPRRQEARGGQEHGLQLSWACGGGLGAQTEGGG